MRRSHAILPGKVVAVNIPWYLRLRRMPLRGAALVSGMLALAYWITYRLGGTSTALPRPSSSPPSSTATWEASPLASPQASSAGR